MHILVSNGFGTAYYRVSTLHRRTVPKILYQFSVYHVHLSTNATDRNANCDIESPYLYPSTTALNQSQQAEALHMNSTVKLSACRAPGSPLVIEDINQ